MREALRLFYGVEFICRRGTRGFGVDTRFPQGIILNRRIRMVL